MLENIEIPAGMQAVEDVTKCDSFTKEYRGGILLLKGDKIQFGSKVATAPFTHKVNGNDVTDKIPYIACSINGKTPKFVPISTFRKRPRNIIPYLESSTLVRDIQNCSTPYELYTLLKDRQITVTGMHKCELIDRNKSNFETREFVFREGELPIFE